MLMGELTFFNRGARKPAYWKCAGRGWAIVCRIKLYVPFFVVGVHSFFCKVVEVNKEMCCWIKTWLSIFIF
jgi:hypothetical protein